ncbi:MAG TPA: CxxC-x17-CxxC domain-containing protein [Candidatus Nanoarchaeia archaeon]|nr:CxxC-x17-CxxC domain-containing protein [Candidatus Nanoarchaeia archaeon]
MNRFGGDRGSGGRGFGGNRGGGGGFRRDFGPREMHKATCADCKKECEVPFKPTEGRPVYCKDCYPKHRQF